MGTKNIVQEIAVIERSTMDDNKDRVSPDYFGVHLELLGINVATHLPSSLYEPRGSSLFHCE